MKWLFSRKKQGSGCFARERLNALLKKERSSLTEGAVIERIKKEVSAVLIRYSGEKNPPEVYVTFSQGSQCNLAASVSVANTEPNTI